MFPMLSVCTNCWKKKQSRGRWINMPWWSFDVSVTKAMWRHRHAFLRLRNFTLRSVSTDPDTRTVIVGTVSLTQSETDPVPESEIPKSPHPESGTHENSKGTLLTLGTSLNSLKPSDAYYAPVKLPSLVQIMACRLAGAKPMSQPML